MRNIKLEGIDNLFKKRLKTTEDNLKGELNKIEDKLSSVNLELEQLRLENAEIKKKL